ncbi:TDT family transporter [Promicromonospora sp. NPDC057138]|uniref:SLAC1 family transporter n=1 Tax=Promicromonospora sp. NPDC057138 TaxID=3346031 RepID=UPI00364269CE
MTSTLSPAGEALGVAAPVRQTLPLDVFGIALGLAGLGGAWAAAAQLLGAPRWPAELAFAASAGFWVVFTAVYLAQSLRRPGKIRSDIEHPVSGPFIAFIPLVAVLLAQHYAEYAPDAGRWVVLAFVALLAVIAARLAAHWITGGLGGAEALHGGYFLPVVAGPFIGSIGLTAVGLHELALYAFGAGLFFWLTLGTGVMYRHIGGGQMPDSMTPTLTAFLAAAATGSIAWLVAHPGSGPLNTPQSLLTGVLFIMLFVQVALIGRYRRIPFGMQYWVFTFPVASTSNYLVRWLGRTDVDAWQVWAWAVLGVATAFICAIAVGSIGLLLRGAVTRARRR